MDSKCQCYSNTGYRRRLKTASRAGLSASLNYDAAGRLRRTSIGGAVTDLLYDGVDLIAEYDSANALKRRYVHGPGIDEPLVWYEGSGTGNKNWLYADHLGSIVASANDAGSSTATYSYSPYGEPNQTTGSRFRYTGQQLIGGLGLYYYKARFYSSARGRFLQTDPIGYADDLNLYAYVGNDPVNFTDPSGLARHFSEGFDDAELNVIPGLPDTAILVTVGLGGIAAAGPKVWAGLRSLTEDVVYEVTGLFRVSKVKDWKFGSFKKSAKWQSQMEKRGWTNEKISEAIGKGKKFSAENLVNKGNSATRYIHPKTGRSVVVDDVTKEIIHVGGNGFKY